MKKSKYLYLCILAITLVLIALGVCLGGCIDFGYGNTYTLEPIDAEKVSVIRYIKYIGDNTSDSVSITTEEEVADIVKVVFCDGKGRTTKDGSMTDNLPTGSTGVMTISIVYQENNQTQSCTFRIYSWKKRYYLNFPYHADYKITADEYNSLAKYMNKNE